MRKKLLSIALSAAMAAFLIPASAFAATQTITMEIAPEEPIVTESDEGPANYYISEELDKEQAEAAQADAEESQTAQHWKELAGEDADKVLMSLDEINQVNMMALGESETNMYDIEQLGGEYDADELAKSLAGTNYDTDRDLYVDGDKVDREAYFGTLKTAINTTGYTGTCTPRYAVAVARTDVKPWPINGVCTWSDEDPAEEIDGAALDVNEPFVIKQVCTVNDVEFYWGYTTNSTGWVKAKHLAVCEDIDQWTDAWKVDAESKDFITVEQDKIVLNPSDKNKYSSDIKLSLGTVLKLVSDEDRPDAVVELGESDVSNSYLVWVPARGESGTFEKRPALISKDYNVSLGYVEMTQANLLDVAFSCLGDKNGWNGKNGTMDSSLFVRSVYKCFGFDLPRSANWQQKIPSALIDVTKMSDKEKNDLLAKLPAGTPVYSADQVMLTVGTEDDATQGIGSVGALVASEDETVNLQAKEYTVVLKPIADVTAVLVLEPETKASVDKVNE